MLAHPDAARVGDFVPLFDEGPAECSASISRLEPAFRAPDGQLSGPLASTRITRNPLHIIRDSVGVRLRVSGPKPAVDVNGVPLVGERALTRGELDDGVVVLSGKDLALWVGWIEPLDPAPPVAGLVGESTVMRKLRQQIHRVADLDVPVLLRGATGVGKELVAAAIHKQSGRASSNYVAVNVAGVPPSMAASELFGHRRGAFTGALEERRGYFEQANGGTLFLDEIGDVSFDVQALLLRAVQEGVIQPLGGTTRRVDVRLIAATDSDLESAVARREFREPLLRRFSYEIHVPALRARRDDIGVLFYHLLRERLKMMGEVPRLDAPSEDTEPFVPAAFVARLALHDWPGNVRELANVALKFAIENRGRSRARVDHELWDMVRPRGEAAKTATVEPAADRAKDKDRPSDAEIIAALQSEGFRRERAAKRLGVSKSYLYKRLGGNPVSPIAGEIPIAEIQAALADHPGDLSSAADRLRISTRALRLQMKRLDRGPV